MNGYRGLPPVDLDAVALTLIRISRMIVDFPQIREIDINPLLADPDEGLDRFVRTVKDIKIHFETYSYAGN